MPNWVQNYMTIDPKYADYILNDKNEVDFNLVKKMPSTFENIPSGSSNQPAIYCYLSNKNQIPLETMKQDELCEKLIRSQYAQNANWAEDAYNQLIKATTSTNPHMYVSMDNMYAEGKALVTNYKDYGAMTWYDWSIINWGCKWNASESSYKTDIDPQTKKEYMNITFATPWTSPDAWLESLCKLKIPFYLEWIEEQGYHGEYTSDGKTLTKKVLPFVGDDEDEEYEDDDDDYDDDSDEDEDV